MFKVLTHGVFLVILTTFDSWNILAYIKSPFLTVSMARMMGSSPGHPLVGGLLKFAIKHVPFSSLI